MRIARNGDVLAIDRVTNRLLRFSPNGQLLGDLSGAFTAGSNALISAFAFDETGQNVWVASSFSCSTTSGNLTLVDGATGLIRTRVTLEQYLGNDFDALATVSEWRAALLRSTPKRRSVVR